MLTFADFKKTMRLSVAAENLGLSLPKWIRSISLNTWLGRIQKCLWSAQIGRWDGIVWRSACSRCDHDRPRLYLSIRSVFGRTFIC